MKLILRLTLALSVMTPLLAVAPAAADPPSALGCGSVLTTDVTLTADITGCPGDGLIVGRDGITIDLGTHRLSGGLGYSDVAAPGSVGVRIGRHDRVTVRGAATDPMALENNEIVGFETAVLLGSGAEKNTVQGLNLRGVRFGVALRKAHRNTIEGNSVSFAGGQRPEPCVAGPDAEAGIALIDSDRNTVRGNTAQLGLFGILLQRSDGNTIAANEAAPTWSDGNQCDGIALSASKGNRIVDNIAANDVPHGIRIGAGSPDNLLKRNIVFQNGGDGILVQNRKTTLNANRATRNQGWGINAVKAVKASGNGAAENFGPGQCRNVACKPVAPPS
jgi:parallel beta-helix repeat protein